MKKTFAIQPATHSDIQSIHALISSEPTYLQYRSLADITECIDNFVVVPYQGTVIACAAFENYARKIAEIRSIVILPQYRRYGLGEQLVRYLMQRAQPGQEVFVVTSKVAFFKKLGFSSILNEKQVLFYQKDK